MLFQYCIVHLVSHSHPTVTVLSFSWFIDVFIFKFLVCIYINIYIAISSIPKLLGRITIQEPTFDRIIVVYRWAMIILYISNDLKAITWNQELLIFKRKQKMQAGENQKRKRKGYTHKALQEHSNGWFGDSAREFAIALPFGPRIFKLN